MLYPARWKKITVDQSKVLKNRLYRLFRFLWATRYNKIFIKINVTYFIIPRTIGTFNSNKWHWLWPDYRHEIHLGFHSQQLIGAGIQRMPTTYVPRNIMRIYHWLIKNVILQRNLKMRKLIGKAYEVELTSSLPLKHTEKYPLSQTYSQRIKPIQNEDPKIFIPKRK